jgi:hypothetical protein
MLRVYGTGYYFVMAAYTLDERFKRNSGMFFPFSLPLLLCFSPSRLTRASVHSLRPHPCFPPHPLHLNLDHHRFPFFLPPPAVRVVQPRHGRVDGSFGWLGRRERGGSGDQGEGGGETEGCGGEGQGEVEEM